MSLSQNFSRFQLGRRNWYRLSQQVVWTGLSIKKSKRNFSTLTWFLCQSFILILRKTEHHFFKLVNGFQQNDYCTTMQYKFAHNLIFYTEFHNKNPSWWWCFIFPVQLKVKILIKDIQANLFSAKFKKSRSAKWKVPKVKSYLINALLSYKPYKKGLVKHWEN